MISNLTNIFHALQICTLHFKCITRIFMNSLHKNEIRRKSYKLSKNIVYVKKAGDQIR